MISRNGRAATYYATQLGWAVFPLAPRSKIPLVAGGRGVKDAARNTEQIQAWWHWRPDGGIALACGTPSGVFAIDVDPRNGGDDSLAELEAMHGLLPATVESLTGGGGRHILYRCSGPVRCSVLAPGVDIKGTGGYVVLPPSIHPNGRLYRWEISSRPDEVPIAEPPGWLVSMLDRRAPVQRHEHAGPVDPDSFLLGTAFKAAGWLGPQIAAGKWAVQCPNEAEHTTGYRFDGSTILFAPGPEQTRGFFHCSHSHCQRRFW